MEEKNIFWCPECDFYQEGDEIRNLEIVHCPQCDEYLWQFIQDPQGYFSLVSKETDAVIFETPEEAKIVLTKFLEVVDNLK